MNTEEKARELMAQEHLNDEQRHQTMVNRAAEVEQTHHEEDVNEKARESLAQERKHQETREESMLERSIEEIS
ncbi:hypothetical protein [Cyanothece sp. BG0011]|uniref:hypothetical protein n=1 Tax=Cyanothece sp. BG0011 TaxID=2082950 RepID=UPI000D1E148E|nr:hypothetical protein [Cyanothece sp. BG0011]